MDKLLPIDKLTGMPELPVDYYWHVYLVEESLYYGRVDVALMKNRYTRSGKLKRRGERLDSVLFNPDEWLDAPEKLDVEKLGILTTDREYLVGMIRYAAQAVYASHERTLRREELRKVAKSLAGNYPPKKLEA
jgi:hypothetical protein